MTTVRDLIEQLEDLNPNAEVRVAYQQSHPLWLNIGGVVSGTERGEPSDPEECPVCGGYLGDPAHAEADGDIGHDEGCAYSEALEVVYLPENGSAGGYASKELWQ